MSSPEPPPYGEPYPQDPSQPGGSYGQPYQPPASGGDPYAGYQPYGSPSPYGQHPGFGYGESHQGALTSMILGIASVVTAVVFGCCFAPLAIIGLGLGGGAVFTAVKAKKEIDTAPQRFVNRGQAVAGLVTGIIGMVLAALVLLFAVLWFGLAVSGSY